MDSQVLAERLCRLRSARGYAGIGHENVKVQIDPPCGPCRGTIRDVEQLVDEIKAEAEAGRRLPQ